MQEIVVGEERVYEGLYEGLYDSRCMRVVADYRGEGPVYERWGCHFPGDFIFPKLVGPSVLEDGHFEMTFRAVLSERLGEFGFFGLRTPNHRLATITEVLYCRPVPYSRYDRRLAGPFAPPYADLAVALSDRLWLTDASSRSDALRALAPELSELIGAVESQAAAYAIVSPLARLLGRLREVAEAGRADEADIDRVWSQALIVLCWLSHPASDLTAYAAAVAAHSTARGCDEDALGWIRRGTDEAAAALAASLRAPDLQTRGRSAEALAWVGREAEAAVAALVGAIEDTNQGVRAAAAVALGQIGPAAATAAPALIEALGDVHPDVRKAAVWALWRIRPAPGATVPLLIGALGRHARPLPEGHGRQLAYLDEWEKTYPKEWPFYSDRDILLWSAESDRRSSAMELLGGYGPEAQAAVPMLRAARSDDDPFGLPKIAKALGEIDPHALTDLLIEVLRGHAGVPRHVAAEISGNLGSRAAAVIPALLEAMVDEDQVLRWKAARALNNIDPDAAVARLVEVLKGPDPVAQRRAAGVLNEFGLKAAVAVPILIEALRDADAGLRQAAVWALGSLGPEGKSAVPALVARLGDPDPATRRLSASALVWVGTEAAIAVPALIKALGDGDRTVRESVIQSLGTIGVAASAVVPDLIEALTDEDPVIRGAAARALGEFGPDGEAAVPALIGLLAAEDRSARGADGRAPGAGGAAPDLVYRYPYESPERLCGLVTGTLGKIGPAAVEGLIEAMEGQTTEDRLLFAAALADLGQGAESAVPALADGLGRSRATDRVRALEALAKFGPAAGAAVPALVATLASRGVYDRSLGAWVLGRIGPGAAAAVPALLDLLGDKTPLSVRLAAWALEQIDPGTAGVTSLAEARRPEHAFDDAPVEDIIPTIMRCLVETHPS